MAATLTILYTNPPVNLAAGVEGVVLGEVADGLAVAGYDAFFLTIRNPGANPITALSVLKSSDIAAHLAVDATVTPTPALPIPAGGVALLTIKDEPLGLLQVKATSAAGTNGVEVTVRGRRMDRS